MVHSVGQLLLEKLAKEHNFYLTRGVVSSGKLIYKVRC